MNVVSPLDVAPEDNPSSELEPDIAVLAKDGDDYQDGYPSASDVTLLIEISDSTLCFDLGPKARPYARAGIADYWVFDKTARRIVVHRDPEGGTYTTVTAHVEGESVAPLVAPDAALQVSHAFPTRRV